MTMMSPSFPPSAAAEARLLEGPLSLDEAVSRVASSERGGLVTFSGCVRADEEGRPIKAIIYEAYNDMALKELGKIIDRARRRWNVAAHVQHRIGRVSAGEPSLVVACAGVHRAEAFEACRFVVDEIKKTVPLWKVRFE